MCVFLEASHKSLLAAGRDFNNQKNRELSLTKADLPTAVTQGAVWRYNPRTPLWCSGTLSQAPRGRLSAWDSFSHREGSDLSSVEQILTFQFIFLSTICLLPYLDKEESGSHGLITNCRNKDCITDPNFITYPKFFSFLSLPSLSKWSIFWEIFRNLIFQLKLN